MGFGMVELVIKDGRTILVFFGNIRIHGSLYTIFSETHFYELSEDLSGAFIHDPSL